MKKILIFSIILVLIFSGYSIGQDINNGQKSEQKNVPQAVLKVNKGFDKIGNLLRDDSLYTGIYSSTRRDLNSFDNIHNCYKQFYGIWNNSGNYIPLKLKFPDSGIRNYIMRRDALIYQHLNNFYRIDRQKIYKDVLKNNSKSFNKQPVNSITI